MKAIVSGGASGIGRAICQLIIDQGGQVVFGDIDLRRGIATQKELGAKAQFVQWDVTNEEQTINIFQRAIQDLTTIDAVFANAGSVGVTGPIEQTQLSAWNETMDQLVTSVFLTSREAIRAMSPQRHGSVVVTASVASLHGGLGPHAYTAAKFAVRGLVESLAVQIAPQGLRINGLAPGGVVTSLAAELVTGNSEDLESTYKSLASRSSSGIPTTAMDVAHAAIFLAGDHASRINGTLITVDGGDAVLPHAGKNFYQ